MEVVVAVNTFALLWFAVCVSRAGGVSNIVATTVLTGVPGVTSYRASVSFAPIPEAWHYVVFTATNGVGGSVVVYPKYGLVFTLTPPVPRPQRFGHSEFVGFRKYPFPVPPPWGAVGFNVPAGEHGRTFVVSSCSNCGLCLVPVVVLALADNAFDNNPRGANFTTSASFYNLLARQARGSVTLLTCPGAARNANASCSVADSQSMLGGLHLRA